MHNAIFWAKSLAFCGGYEFCWHYHCIFVCQYIKFKEFGKIDILAFVGILGSLLFISLLFLPLSPSALKMPSIIALCIWSALGGVVYWGSVRKALG